MAEHKIQIADKPTLDIINNAVSLKTKKASTLPTPISGGCAVVLNNEIHILYIDDHYKWNGFSWSKVSTLPYTFREGCAVVLNNEIHILGGSSNADKHYKWDGAEWTSVSTLPFYLWDGSAVVLNNEIHILGTNSSDSYTKHYKWNGYSWSEVSTLPYNYYDSLGNTVVINNEIHILGGGVATNHYKWDGSTWTSVSTLPYDFTYGVAIVYNNEIHIMGGYKTAYRKCHYKFNGAEWVKLSDLPFMSDYCCSVVYNGSLHLLCDDWHYILDCDNLFSLLKSLIGKVSPQISTQIYSGTSAQAFTATGKGKLRMTYFNNGKTSVGYEAVISKVTIDGDLLGTTIKMGYFDNTNKLQGSETLEFMFNSSISVTVSCSDSTCPVLIQFEVEQ